MCPNTPLRLRSTVFLGLFFLVLPLIVPSVHEVQAQAERASIVADTLTDRETIRALEAKMQQGVLHRDLETLRRLWAEAFMVNAPRNVVVPNRKAVLDVFRKGIPNYSTFDPHIERLRVTGDLAVVMGRETVKPVGDAPHAGKTVKRRYTHVWRERDDRWRLVARHAHITDVE